MKPLIRFIATGAYSGYFPIVPGTIGTIPAWLIAWFLIGHSSAALVGAAFLAFALSVWSASRAEGHLGHDSKKIVIDEWAGMFVALLFLPYRLDVYVAAFILFRFYDVIKPFPAGHCESYPRGWGVTLDDIIAGIYANLTCRLCLLALGRLNWFGF